MPNWNYTVYGSEGREADPIQGHDCDVWIEDEGNPSSNVGIGNKILLGSFNSAVITLRFSTEPYQTFKQRINRLLDGDIQIAFVLERGWIDTAVHAQTFGFLNIGRRFRINRSPRLTITLNVDSNGELPSSFQEWYLPDESGKRVADGRIVLKRAKMDSLHIAVSAGKQVGVNQWQGLAEGYEVVGPYRAATETNLMPDVSTTDHIDAFYPMNPRAAVNDPNMFRASDTDRPRQT